jgi:hypothetical protein
LIEKNKQYFADSGVSSDMMGFPAFCEKLVSDVMVGSLIMRKNK